MHRSKKNTISFFTITCLLLLSFSSYAAETTQKHASGHSNLNNETSFFQKVNKWWTENKPGQDNKLIELRSELQAKEGLLAKVEEGMASIVNNARPKCANGTVNISFDSDPRIELRNEIATLKNKIAELEK